MLFFKTGGGHSTVCNRPFQIYWRPQGMVELIPFLENGKHCRTQTNGRFNLQSVGLTQPAVVVVEAVAVAVAVAVAAAAAAAVVVVVVIAVVVSSC